ncbi:MAG: M1 family aminopeptidase, partial [Saprospiraceae bacterium]
MKNKVFIILTLFVICKISNAQPLELNIGCHNALMNNSAFLRHEPTQEELLMIENSNKRSDSIDISNYNIYLNVTQVSAKSISAHTLVSFRTKLNDLESMTLDLKDLSVDSILYKGNKINFNYDKSIIVLFFGEKLTKDSKTSVEIFYHGIPSRDPVWGGVYFVDKYIYNLGIGLSTTPPNFGKVWFPCFDNFVERSTYDYHVTSVSPSRAYCVGHFVSEDSLSPIAVQRHYRMDNEIPTYLSNFAVSDYVVDRSITTSIGNANLPIDLIARSSELNTMKVKFAKLPEALDAFEYWFGHYRFERIGFVATTVGAMEHPTNTAYPISTITGGTLTDNEALYAHEFGHQWWGNLTTLDDARDMWIKEGNAEYCAHLFLEYAYDRKRFISKVKDNLSTILFNAHVNDSAYLPLSPMPYKNTYGTTTYKKGAAMIHNLRGYLGDSLYRVVCHTIFDSLTGRSMNAYEYRDFINRNSPVKVTNFFDDYIFNPGYTGFYIDSFSQSPILSKNIYFLNIKQKLHHAEHLCTDIPLTISCYDRNLNRLEFKVRVDGYSSWVEVETPWNFTPEIFLVNEDQKLNYASLQDYVFINSTGSL